MKLQELLKDVAVLSCTAAEDLEIHEVRYDSRAVQPGDLFAFENTGAYCMTEGISLFLSRALPSVVLLKDGEPLLVRKALETNLINMPNYESEENENGKTV